MTDEEFLELINHYEYNYKIGTIVKGTVVSYGNSELLVDIGAKNTAICPISEVITDGLKIEDTLKINEQYDFVIISEEDSDGSFYISNKRIALLKNIETLKNQFEKDETITVKIINKVKGGYIANAMGAKGFIPLSQVMDEANVGDDIEVKIIAFEDDTNSFVFSNKKIYQESIDAVKKEIFEKIELNMVVKGTVTRLTEFGAFVDIGGAEGLLPLSQISWKWIDNPAEVLNLNDKIDVEIIGIDKEKLRISLSLKSLIENPWQKAKEALNTGDIVTGKITSKKVFGCFVEVYPNVEGLLSKKCIEKYSKKHNASFEENDEIKVLITNLDFDNQKIHLELPEES